MAYLPHFIRRYKDMLPSRTKVLYQSNSESSYMLFATFSIKAALQPDVNDNTATQNYSHKYDTYVFLKLICWYTGEIKSFSHNHDRKTFFQQYKSNEPKLQKISFFFLNLKLQLSFSSSPSFVFFLYSQAGRVANYPITSKNSNLDIFRVLLVCFCGVLVSCFRAFRQIHYPLFGSFKKFRSFYFSQMLWFI